MMPKASLFQISLQLDITDEFQCNMDIPTH